MSSDSTDTWDDDALEVSRFPFDVDALAADAEALEFARLLFIVCQDKPRLQMKMQTMG